FSATSRQMVDACVAAGVHYLDVTGEIEVFEAIHARSAEAAEAGVVLLPGAGFDVVPSDCLAGMLARALPSATSLKLAFSVSGGMSRGTLRTTIEGIATGGQVRRDGSIVDVPVAREKVTAFFLTGPRTAISIPWGDIATAYHSTGIPNITTHMALPLPGGLVSTGQRLMAPLMR
ncbi:saccharopine dehydrogenase, partial [Kibdelosporangium lantanae]